MLSRSCRFLCASSSSAPKKPILPNLCTFTSSVRGVSHNLLETQKEGYGVSLVQSMGFDPKTDVDAFTLHQYQSSSSSQDQNNTNQIFANDLKTFSSAAQPIGCFSGTVSKDVCDSSGRIHTGVLATLADVETSLHLWALAGPKSVHVSVAIDLNMCSTGGDDSQSSNNKGDLPPTAGERLLIITRCPKMGKQLAFLEFSLYTLSEETLTFARDAARDTRSKKGKMMTRESNGHTQSVLLHQKRQLNEMENKKGKIYELLDSSSDELLNGTSLAHQASLLYLYGAPFATGWHEKSFIYEKKK